MTKIRCGDSLGIDLDQVAAWTKLKYCCGGSETLTLFFIGTDSGFNVCKETVGEKAFNRLHKLLLEQFIDLVVDTNDGISVNND